MNTTLNTKTAATLFAVRLNYIMENQISLMPDGKFLNLHNGKEDTCDGIVLLASGHVCPIYRNSVCSLNPFNLSKNKTVVLSTFSVAGPITPNYTSIEKTVNEYNEQMLKIAEKGYSYPTDDMIIAYHSFNPEWDK